MVVHGLRLVQPHRPLEIMTSFRRLLTGVDHPIVVVVIIAQLLRDGQRFAHAHDGQLTPRQQPDDGRSLGVDLLEVRQVAALHVSDSISIE